MGKIFGISDILNAVFNRDANKLKVETDLQIDAVTVTDVTIHDAVATDNKLKVNEDGSVPVELKGSLVQNAFEIIPSDAADLTHETIAIYVGFDGDLKIDLVNGETITMYNLAAGAWHPIAAKKVYATGTTATYILGAYLI